MLQSVNLKLDNLLVTFEADELYLQKRFGTLMPGVTGPLKFQRKNWDNGEFFDGQSNDCFNVLIERDEFKAKAPNDVTDEAINAKWSEIEERYAGTMSSQDMEALVKKETRAEAGIHKVKVKLNNYFTVKSVFRNGEWQWKLEYSQSNIQRSGKRINTYPAKIKRYENEELGARHLTEEELLQREVESQEIEVDRLLAEMEEAE